MQKHRGRSVSMNPLVRQHLRIPVGDGLCAVPQYAGKASSIVGELGSSYEFAHSDSAQQGMRRNGTVAVPYDCVLRDRGIQPAVGWLIFPSNQHFIAFWGEKWYVQSADRKFLSRRNDHEFWTDY